LLLRPGTAGTPRQSFSREWLMTRCHPLCSITNLSAVYKYSFLGGMGHVPTRMGKVSRLVVLGIEFRWPCRTGQHGGPIVPCNDRTPWMIRSSKTSNWLKREGTLPQKETPAPDVLFLISRPDAYGPLILAASPSLPARPLKHAPASSTTPAIERWEPHPHPVS